MLTKHKVVVGTIGSDAHMIGGWVLSQYLKDAGFDVTFLGAVVSQEQFVSTAVETKAKAIMVSSMYGMGLQDCEGLRQKCKDGGIEDIVLYAGGTVVPTPKMLAGWADVERRFEEIGFDRVFPNTVELEEVVDSLKSHLRLND